MPTDPLEEVYVQMREMTRPATPVRDDRGPLVYDLTMTESLNGIDPSYKDLPGGGPMPK